jgi:hypothetical protein
MRTFGFHKSLVVDSVLSYWECHWNIACFYTVHNLSTGRTINYVVHVDEGLLMRQFQTR